MTNLLYKREEKVKQMTKVAEFTEAGAVTYLLSLKTARFNHACSKFVTDTDDLRPEEMPRH